MVTEAPDGSQGTQAPTLTRSLTLRPVVLFGLAYLAPMIVLGTFGVLAEATTGSVPTAYLLALIALLFTALSYGKMSKLFPVAGSAYTTSRNRTVCRRSCLAPRTGRSMLSTTRVANQQRKTLAEGCCRRVLIGYARVSTAEQNPAHQIDALARAGVAPDDVHVDHASGAKASRLQLDLVLKLLRAGDTLVITRLDRLGRSVLHLVTLGAGPRERGIGLRVIEQGIDTSTAEGRAMFGMLSVPSSNTPSCLNARWTGWLPRGPGAATADGARS